MATKQLTLAVNPNAAMTLMLAALAAKGYEAQSAQHEGSDIYTVRYFPRDLLSGKGAFRRVPRERIMALIAELPDCPALDHWTRLALTKGRQRSLGDDIGDWERHIKDGPCMDCERLGATTTRGEGLDLIALCRFCADYYDRQAAGKRPQVPGLVDVGAKLRGIDYAELGIDRGDDADAPY